MGPDRTNATPDFIAHTQAIDGACNVYGKLEATLSRGTGTSPGATIVVPRDRGRVVRIARSLLANQPCALSAPEIEEALRSSARQVARASAHPGRR